MANWYKLFISDWNDGTSKLTLEQEAAYLRVVNAIRQTEMPIRNDLFVLGGLWRCNDRKAKRLLKELVEAKKLYIEDGRIGNARAINDASTLRRLSVDRASAGRRGGVESANTRRNALKNNNGQGDLLQPDKNRLDKSPPLPPKTGGRRKTESRFGVSEGVKKIIREKLAEERGEKQ